MTNNKLPKYVSFNTNNANDKRFLNHVKRQNFSGYAKKLILADMAQKDAAIIVEKETATSMIVQFGAELYSRTNNVDKNTGGRDRECSRNPYISRSIP